MTPAPAPVAEPEDDSDDVVALLEQLQAENLALQAQIAAIAADDPRAEAAKWRRAYDHSVRQQSEAMDRAHKEGKRHEVTYRRLMRCGKAVGEGDPEKVPTAVEAFVRQHKAIAA